MLVKARESKKIWKQRTIRFLYSTEPVRTINLLSITQKVCPIMGAIVGPNVALSNFIGREVIIKVAEDFDSDNVCKSTEELLSRFEAYNKDREKNGYHKVKMILGSMDIEKWYPSMLTRPSAKEIKDMIVESGLEFVELDYDAISRYLGEQMTKEEIVDEKFEEIVYKKNKNKQKKKIS